MKEKETEERKANNNLGQKPSIIFAIPSYNEVENISHLTRQIDRGIQLYFKKNKCFIVNVDNDSRDGTKEAFLKTPTQNEKIYLSSRGYAKNQRGKGFHMKMALRLAKKTKAAAIGFIDGDVSSAKPEWTRDLVYPTLQGYDTVLPVYLRNEYDGSITNHFVYPILSGLLLTNIRQPIAGEIGLSARAIDLLLSEKWPEAANHFGVDIYLLTQSLFHNLPIAQTFIGVKDHKPSAPKLDSMFVQVADSLLGQLAKYKNLWKDKKWSGQKAPLIKTAVGWSGQPPKLAFNYKEMKEDLLKDYLEMEPETNHLFGDLLGNKIKAAIKNGRIDLKKTLWVEVIYKIIKKDNPPNKQELLVLRTVFFARFLTFYKEVIEKTYQESEKEIINQARLFKKKKEISFNLMKKKVDKNFADLGVSSEIVRQLKEVGYLQPTAVQEQAIPPALEGKDVIGIAQTGTGKTLAFVVPIIQESRKKENDFLSLVVLPTRELAAQIDQEIRKVGQPFGLKTALLIGGDPINPQTVSLKAGPQVIIATPGRLLDHLRRKTVNLRTVKILVLDEVDRMLDMGFLPQVKMILKAVPEKRRTMIFSATVSSEVIYIASKEMNSPIRVETAPTGTTVENVFQEIFITREENKSRLIKKILEKHSGPVLIFANTKYKAGRLAESIRQMGYPAAEMHSNRNLSQRKAALEGFRKGRYRVLVATDIVARGIDIAGIELVVNYDLPRQAEDYVHRIGRTARAGKKGEAISLARPSEQKEVRAIEWLIKKKLKVAETIETSSASFAKPRLVYSSRKYNRGKLG